MTVNTDGIGLWTLHDGPQLFRDQVLPIGNQDARDVSIMMLGTDGNRFYYSLNAGFFAYDLAKDVPIDPPDFLNGNGFMFLPDGAPVPLYANDPFRFLSPAFTDMDMFGFSPDGRLLADYQATRKSFNCGGCRWSREIDSWNSLYEPSLVQSE